LHYRLIRQYNAWDLKWETKRFAAKNIRDDTMQSTVSGMRKQVHREARRRDGKESEFIFFLQGLVGIYSQEVEEEKIVTMGAVHFTFTL
jgi:hypothetical protein